MTGETLRLAEYAAGFKFSDIPAHVVQYAKNAIADGIGACVFSYDLPWSKFPINYAQRYGSGGKSYILGLTGARVQAPQAAFANGAMAHVFELDAGTRPSTGAHPYATIFPALLATAQEQGGAGRDVLAAFVAATEVMLRIGLATKLSNSHRGFHSAGTTGPFGAAVAVGRLLGFGKSTMASAIGAAGSLSSGLVQFSKSSTGAMTKCLHFGRAAESGVLAARLAGGGFESPHDIVEGEYGFLRAFCDEYDLSELTRDLGEKFLTLMIYTKRFCCHGSAQYPLAALETILGEHRISIDDIAEIDVTGAEERVHRQNIMNPPDLMKAQYSVPFCVALAFVRNLRDPRSFDETALRDTQIRSLVSRVNYHASTEPREMANKGSTVTITMKSGAVLRQSAYSFKGLPSSPADKDDVYERYSILTRHCPKSRMDEVFERIQNLENEANVDWLHA